MAKVKDIGGKKFIWDRVRKKYVILQPEELQRQILIDILIEKFNYPPGLFSVETGIKIGKLKKRFDLMILNSNGSPLLLAECKAENIPIDEEGLRQLMTYNKKIKAEILLLFNGNDLYCWELIKGEYLQIQEIPTYFEN